MSEIYRRYGELDRLPLGAATPTTNTDFNAVDLMIAGDRWGWAGSIWTWFVFGKGYPINPPLQSLTCRSI